MLLTTSGIRFRHSFFWPRLESQNSVKN